MIDSELPFSANHQDLFEASLSGNDCKELDNGLKTHFMEKDAKLFQKRWRYLHLRVSSLHTWSTPREETFSFPSARSRVKGHSLDGP